MSRNLPAVPVWVLISVGGFVGLLILGVLGVGVAGYLFLARPASRPAPLADPVAQVEDATPATPSPRPAAVLDLDNAIRDYEQNRVGADLRLKGKRFRATATIQAIERDSSDRAVILAVLRSTGGKFPDVTFRFPSGHEAEVADLKTGAKVTVEGTLDGRRDYDVPKPSGTVRTMTPQQAIRRQQELALAGPPPRGFVLVFIECKVIP
jgi:hypothetical protein